MPFKVESIEPKTLLFFVGRTESVSSKRDSPKKWCNGQNIMDIMGPEYGTKIPIFFFGGRPEIPTLGPAIKLKFDQWNESGFTIEIKDMFMDLGS